METRCPNCAHREVLGSHVLSHIDCVTGELFIPLMRVENDQLVPLWPEDFSCGNPSFQ